MSWTRRAFVAGAATAASVAAAGGLALGHQFAHRSDYARRVLERHVGPFDMSADDFARFSQSFDEATGDTFGDPTGWKWSLVRATDGIAGLDRLVGVDADATAKIEAYARALVTHFFTTTNAARLPSIDAAPICFLGASTCGNPFADLSPPTQA